MATPPFKSLFEKFPEISKEWHPAKNGELTPYDVSYSSGKKVWWLCDKGHEWQAYINNRVRGAGCPFCSGRYATSQNNLRQAYPFIADQWHTEKNQGKRPEYFLPGSHYRAWWVCENGHEWQASIKNRTLLGRGCPFCSEKKATAKINLKSLYPEIASQWHPLKNGHLFPENFRPQSNKKVWWLCNRGHEWQARIQDRTIGKNSCPYCSGQTSQLEIRLFCELKAILSGVEWRSKMDGFEIDILLTMHNIGIEVDGFYWHSSRQDVEQKKQKAIESNGITLIRVREAPLEPLGSHDVIYSQNQSEKKVVQSLLMSLQSLLYEDDLQAVTGYLSNGVFTNKDEFRKILSYLPGPPPDKSIASKRPDLSTEWNHKKNYQLLPHMFAPQSNKKVWWICKKGHEWKAAISTRVKGIGCPYCSGRFATMENNLLTARPDLALEWHPTKNMKLTPQDVTPFSHRKVWWKCSNGHEWQATVANRSMSRNCPFCSGKRVMFDNNLFVMNSKLAAEWHPEKNGDLKPIDVTPGSGKKVWWICKNGHEWQARIYSRTKGNGCPYCAGKQIKRDSTR